MSHHATRIETTRASAHPSSSAAKALDPLCTRAKSIALTTHTVGCERKKDPAPGAAESVGVPKSRISSQSACCVNTDWTRPGVARSRLRPIFTDYSPCPPDREPVRGTAADDDFSVTRQLVLPVRCESSRGPDSIDSRMVPSEQRSSGISRGWTKNDDDRGDPSRDSRNRTSRSRNHASTRGRFALLEGGDTSFDLESSREFKMTRWISWSKYTTRIQRIQVLLRFAVAILQRSLFFLFTFLLFRSVYDRREDRPAKITPRQGKYLLGKLR